MVWFKEVIFGTKFGADAFRVRLATPIFLLCIAFFVFVFVLSRSSTDHHNQLQTNSIIIKKKFHSLWQCKKKTLPSICSEHGRITCLHLALLWQIQSALARASCDLDLRQLLRPKVKAASLGTTRVPQVQRNCPQIQQNCWQLSDIGGVTFPAQHCLLSPISGLNRLNPGLKSHLALDIGMHGLFLVRILRLDSLGPCGRDAICLLKSWIRFNPELDGSWMASNMFFQFFSII